MRSTRLKAVTTGAVTAFCSGTAARGHDASQLAARLSGIGEHGIVNLQSDAVKDLIEAKPGTYRIWVDTKEHPGELRGKLFAGMAHM